MNYDLLLLTQDKYVNPSELDWYTKQVLHEDQLVLDALTEKVYTLEKKIGQIPNLFGPPQKQSSSALLGIIFTVLLNLKLG